MKLKTAEEITEYIESNKDLEAFIEIPLPVREGDPEDAPTRYMNLKFTRPNSNCGTLWTCVATSEFIIDAQDIFNGC